MIVSTYLMSMTEGEWRVSVYLNGSYKFREPGGQIFTRVKFKTLVVITKH